MKRFFLPMTAFMGVTGVGIQFYFTLMRKLSEGYSVLYAINHFYSYFTIITNTLITVLLLIYLVTPQHSVSRWFQKTSVSAAMAMYIIIVGSVYYALLHNPNKPFSAEVVATHILHGYMPVAYLFIWFGSFRKSDLSYIQTLKWLYFPAAYFAYVLLRGLLLNKYPYFFMDVEKYGYGIVILNAIGILAVFLLVGVLIVLVDKQVKVKIKD